MDADRDHEIRERAYAIWQRDGQPHGRDAEHWRRAKEELAAEAAAATPAPEAASAKTPTGGGPAIRSRPVSRTPERPAAAERPVERRPNDPPGSRAAAANGGAARPRAPRRPGRQDEAK